MISIIVPIYNVELYLHKCINSILFQTYENIEIILINDGSTDSSQNICEEFATLSDKVRVFHKENEGVSSARNLGLRVAKGEYIAFVDADDWIEPKMYETMVSYLLETNSQMCTSTKYIRDGKVLSNSSLNINSIERKQAIKAILDYNFPSSLCTSLYKKEILDNAYLNEEIHHLEDFEFQFRILYGVQRVAICNTAFYNYRNREGSANNIGFNPKVISCLDIYPIINKYIKCDETISNIYIYATKARMTLVVCAIMVKSKHHIIELEKKLKKNARDVWFRTLFTGVPYKKKILIIILAVSYKLFSFLYRHVKVN